MRKKANTTGKTGRPASSKYDPILQLCRARGLSLETSAKLAGCSLATAHRREADPEYIAGIEHVREKMIGEGVHLLASAFSRAVDKVLEIMDDDGAGHAVQLKAAQSVIDSLLKVREHVTLSNRMAAIAEKLGIGAGNAVGDQGNTTDR